MVKIPGERSRVVRIRDGFIKWAISSKFQISLISIILIYLSIPLFKSEPSITLPLIRDITGVYIGGRILGELADYIIERIKGEK